MAQIIGIFVIVYYLLGITFGFGCAWSRGGGKHEWTLRIKQNLVPEFNANITSPVITPLEARILRTHAQNVLEKPYFK